MTVRKAVGMLVVASVLILFGVLIIAGCTKKAKKHEPAKPVAEQQDVTPAIDPNAVAVVATNQLPAKATKVQKPSDSQKQIAKLQKQLETASKTATEMQKQLECLQKRVELAEGKKATAPVAVAVVTPAPVQNPEVLKVLDRAGENSSIVHMWTGTAATLHELKDEANKPNPQARAGQLTAVNALKAHNLAVRELWLMDSLREQEKKIQRLEFGLTELRQDAENTNDPDVHALRLNSVYEREQRELPQAYQKLASLQAELQELQ